MNTRYFLLLVASMAFGATAQAATITTFAQIGNPLGPPSVITDSQGPQDGGTLTSVDSPGGFIYIADSFGLANATATLADSGSGSVTVNGQFPGGPVTTTATAIWSDTITNTGPTETAYDFDFLITPATLAAGSNNSASTAMFSIQIVAGTETIFAAGAVLDHAGSTSVLSETGTSLNPTFNFLTDIFGGQVDSYSFESYSGNLALGTLAMGESLTVEYIMTVSIFNNGESGAFATIGDPFSINGGPGFSGGIVPAPVPVPAAFWLLISGVLSLGVRARARR